MKDIHNIEEIRISALRGGACRKVMRIHDFPELIKLMFTPQGIEFCQDHNFPSVEVFRKNRDSLEGLGVYVDAGNIAQGQRVRVPRRRYRRYNRGCRD